ncbi:MAG: NUDIX domain-containing protein [Caldilinea sp. CFX5]|nr:NUDIX domain-containing protein [Caldilinea sp. CFX5]
MIDKLAWIHLRDRKILCARTKGNDTYYFPGGKRETGESDQTALLREIKEELNVDLRPETLRFLGQFEAQAHGKPPGVLVRMTCYTAEYDGVLTPSSEIAEIAWLGYVDKARTSLVAHQIFDWLHENSLLA